jgi:hypothetical protein
MRRYRILHFWSHSESMYICTYIAQRNGKVATPSTAQRSLVKRYSLRPIFILHLRRKRRFGLLSIQNQIFSTDSTRSRYSLSIHVYIICWRKEFWCSRSVKTDSQKNRAFLTLCWSRFGYQNTSSSD